MSTVKANNYYDTNGGSNAVLYGVASPVGSMGFRNRIINGDMRIDQRNAGASVATTTTLANTYTVDRWAYNVTAASKFTVQQNAGSVTPPNGFKNYLGCTSSSAYSVTSTDYFLVGQPVEGFNIADLGWGSAGAQSVTLSFAVRSSLTGTFGGALNNSGSTRSCPFSFTVNAANTWEQKTVTLPGDTSGTWLSTNGTGVFVYFSLGAGATYSGTAGAWAGTFYASAAGAVSVVGTNAATFSVTGVQLEAGSTATPFERRDYGRELEMCQRYTQVFTDTYGAFVLGVASTTTSLRCPLQLSSMRGSPNVAYTANTTFASGFRACSSISTIAADPGCVLIGFVPTVAYNTADADYLQILANGKITVSAEL